MSFFINKSNQKFLSKNGKLLTRYKYLLEKYPDIAVVWSMFKRSKDATVCQRIRESNTNTELDIGFTGNGYDESAYDTHVGANDGFIRTWYDQSGNDYHFQQATASNQMEIKDSSTPYTVLTSADAGGVFPDALILALPSVVNGYMIEAFEDGVIYYEVAIPTTYTRYSNFCPAGWLETVVFSRVLSSLERDSILSDMETRGAGSFGNWATLTSLYRYWRGRSDLKTFPLIDTSNVSNFTEAWYNCSSLTSFPSINVSSTTNLTRAWDGCSSLTSFPLIDTSGVFNLSFAWNGCSSLTSFPLIDTSLVTKASSTWYNCSSLTSFPSLSLSNVTNFNGTWYNCSSLTSFPLIDTSKGTSFDVTWLSCSGLISFPSLNLNKGTNYRAAWLNCSSMTDFPSGMFNAWTGTPINSCFYRTWESCTSLTATSVENILNSIDTSGKSAPAGTGTQVEITIDYDTGTGTPSISTAVTNLKSRGWQINLNGVLQ